MVFDIHNLSQKAYFKPLIPISIENLVSDQNIKPPIIQKQACRPKTERIKKRVWQRKQTRRGNFFDWGYNRGRCTGLPASDGRSERARDRLEEIQRWERTLKEEEDRSQESENETIFGEDEQEG
jgi:hypothetical protein